jgi:hypothetical protein
MDQSHELGNWHAVIDKNTGRTYYYNDITKKTTWDKPSSLQTPEERQRAEEDLKTRVDFFRAMECNIYRALDGESVTPRHGGIDLMEEEMLLDEELLRSSPTLPLRQRQNSADSTGSNGSGPGSSIPMRTRTISTIDSEMIEYLKTRAFDGNSYSRNAQAKDDGSGEHTRTLSGSFTGGSPAGLLDGGADAKGIGCSFREDKFGEGGVSLYGSTPPSGPNSLSSDFDFLKEFDYLQLGKKSTGKDSHSPKIPSKLMAGSSAQCGNVGKVILPSKLKRRNSTSTIFVNSTMETQDNDATIKCICVVIRAHMRSAHRRMKLPDARYDVFLDAAYQDADVVSYDDKLQAEGKSSSSDDRLYGDTSHPVVQSKAVFGEQPESYGRERSRSGSHSGQRTMAIPSLDEIESFFTDIFVKSQLEGECVIMSLIYCERLVKETKGRLSIRYDNWRSILFACLVMSSKVWDDLSMWNVDFSHICSSFDLHRINELERAMLDVMHYRIKVSAGEYAKYYFHLRSMMSRLRIIPSDAAAVPLDLVGARRLQLATENLEGKFSTTDSDNSQGRPRRITSATSNIPIPGSLDRPRVGRTVSSDASSSVSRSTTIFVGVGLEELMHDVHTDADGADRTTALKLKVQRERAEAKLA